MNIIRVAAITGGLAVVLGAFGAHTLKELLSAEQLGSFETGVRYQFYHAIVLLFCGLLVMKRQNSKINIAAKLFVTGIILFSGSIYLLSTRTVTGIENISFLGPVTPIGGLFFISGWVLLAIGAKHTTSN